MPLQGRLSLKQKFRIGFVLLIPPFFLLLKISINLHQSQTFIDKDALSVTPEVLIPTNVAICEAILSRTKKRVSITEDDDVCLDGSHPHRSIMKIFTSGFLAEVGRLHGVNVEYRHRCGKSRTLSSEKKRTTMQEILPRRLVWLLDLEDVDWSLVVNKCEKCVHHHFSGSMTHWDHCNILEGGTNEGSSSLWEVAFPSIRENIRQGIREHKESLMTLDPQEYTSDNVSGNALISVSCSYNVEQLCVKHYRHIYAREIPSHVKRIDVLTDPFTNERRGEELAQLLHWLNRLYPTVAIHLNVEKSTAIAYLRMMEARYVMCPSSTTNACLLPSLSTTNFATVIDAPAAWTHPLSSVFGPNILFSSSSLHLHSHCFFLRGRHGGSWVPNINLAPQLQYSSPLYHYAAQAEYHFHPTLKLQYRKSTTYKWKEESPWQTRTCPIRLLTLESFCKVMSKLQLSRIFFLGDSLTLHQAQSFWKLMDQTNNPTPLQESNLDNHIDNWTRNIQCPNSTFYIRVAYARNDQLVENTHPVSRTQSLQNCNGYCFPWKNRYREYRNTGNTLLIANTGPHHQDLAQYKLHFDRFLTDVESVAKINQDLIFFRSSVPGHDACQMATEPFPTYQDYKTTGTERYRWNLFTDFNEYSSRVLFDLSRLQNNMKMKQTSSKGHNHKEHVSTTRANVKYMDVYPMTVLRPDGHIGSVSECPSCTEGKGDCLHYNLPGPLDWWNHLMHSQLTDLVTEMQMI